MDRVPSGTEKKVIFVKKLAALVVSTGTGTKLKLNTKKGEKDEKMVG